MPNSHDIQPSLAKKMVQSYQASVPTDTAIRALTFDASEVRAYLADTSIVNLAVFLAHNENWANNNYGEENNAEITVVLVGTDANGDAVKSSASGFLDYANPCPSSCSSYNEPTFWD